MQPNDMEVVTLDRTRIRTATSLVRALTIVVAAALALGFAQAPRAGAHDDGTTAHLWLEHIKPMATPGSINSSTNPVDWTKLKGVPADIADGADAGVEGAGPGLFKYGVGFFVDITKAQRRVKSCPAGQGMVSIDQQGNPTCVSGPLGFVKEVVDAGPLCNTGCVVATVIPGPGTWQISAKAEVYQSDFSVDKLSVLCHLDAGGKTTQTTPYVKDSWAAVTFRLQLVATLSSPYHASLVCRDYDTGEARAVHVSIIAIRVTP